MRVLVNGTPVSLEQAGAVDHRRVLDFGRGILFSTLRRDGSSVSVQSLRFASLAERHVAAEVAEICLGQPATLDIELELAGTTIYDLNGQERHLAIASEIQLHLRDELILPDEPELGQSHWSVDVDPDETVRLSRIVAFSAAGSDYEARAQANNLAMRFRSEGSVRQLYERHVRSWKQRWSNSDVLVEGDDAGQKALRFAAYHLISAANPEDEHVSIGARALSGDGYKGHVFWDTEIFMLPFYTLTWPAAARSLLMYRYHTLPAARAKAEQMGYRGALYAWESTDSGEETTPRFAMGPQHKVMPVLCGEQEHHISADIAYAVWEYWQATRDIGFLLCAGAEILLETSRFWASRAHLENDDKYHIRRVIGTDEYHEGVDDDAYTNVMAAFNLQRGLEVSGLVRRRWPERWLALAKKLHLAEDELALWADVRERLFTGFDPDTGLFEQFAGFFKLDEVDLRDFADRTAPIDVILGTERTRRSQVIKQADVVMFLFLLGSEFERRVQEANFDYYEPRTGHGSSLSPPAHAMVAARLGRVGLAKRFFDETAAIDLDDTTGNAAGGVHIGALGGLWQAAVFGFGGLQLGESGLHLDPHLPEDWRRLTFPVKWRKRRLRIDITGDPRVAGLTLETGRPVSVSIGGIKRRLSRGETWRCEKDRSGQWREVVP